MSEIRSQATPVVDKARGELGVVIHNHVCVSNLEDCVGECYVAAAALQTAGWSKPRTVNIASELDALPDGSVALFGDQPGIRRKGGKWDLVGLSGWHTPADLMDFPGFIPASVLFTPGDAG